MRKSFYLIQYFFAPFCSQLTSSAFVNKVCICIIRKMRVVQYLFVAVSFTRNKYQLQTPNFAFAQHVVIHFFATHKCSGVKSEHMCRTGQSQQMVGICSAKTYQVCFVFFFCISQHVFQFAPFIARNVWVQSIFPFHIHCYTVLLTIRQMQQLHRWFKRYFEHYCKCRRSICKSKYEMVTGKGFAYLALIACFEVEK